MLSVLRFVGAVVAGIAVALVLLIAVELWSTVVHPVPADFTGSMEEMCAHVANYPHWVLAVATLFWGLMAWASAWIARTIGGRHAAWVICALLLAAVVMNVAMLPYPLWFKGAAPIVVAAGAAMGSQWIGRRGPQSDGLEPS